MPQLHIEIPKDALKRAKVAAIGQGVTLKAWLESLIVANTEPAPKIKLREPRA